MESSHLLLWLREHVPATADLQTDSRALRSGDVFLAYPMGAADNRPYIDDAIARGAAAVLCDASEGGGPPLPLHKSATSIPMLLVPGLTTQVGPLAAAWYGQPSQALFVVGVTGTNGKTSCTSWIAQALNALNTRCAIVGTLGSGWPDQLRPTGFTTPDAPQLARLLAQFRTQHAAAAAMEVSSHALAQGRVNGVAFDTAVFTNLTQDHLDYHHTLAAYEAAKARLFDWPGLKSAVINQDDPVGRRLIARLADKVRLIAYGLDLGNQMGGPAAIKEIEEIKGIKAVKAAHSLRATTLRTTEAGTTAFTLVSDWGKAELEIPVMGAFNVGNVLAVIGALLTAGLEWEAILTKIAGLEPINGRMQPFGGDNEPLVVVDYAHTPDALEKALAALRPVARARGGALICLFGCGGDRDKSKRGPMGAIAQQLADAVVLTSDNPRDEWPGAIIEDIARGFTEPLSIPLKRSDDRALAILQTVRAASTEDVVLIAGRGHETTQEIRRKKHPFCDQDHVQLALAARWRRQNL